MDSITIIAGVIIILIILVFFINTNSNKKKKESQFLQPLFALAEKNNCKISKYDRWNNSIIGIDEDSNLVFNISKINEVETVQQINLADIQKCRIFESSRTVGIEKSSMKVVDKIELAFVKRDKNKPDTIVSFYNSDYDRLTLSGEIQLTDKWCKIANDKIAEIVKIK